MAVATAGSHRDRSSDRVVSRQIANRTIRSHRTGVDRTVGRKIDRTRRTMVFGPTPNADEFVILMIPLLMFTLPVNVFVPDKVSVVVFEPDLVKVPAPVVIAPESVVLPVPLTVRLCAPEMPFTTVSKLLELFAHVCAPPKVTATCCPAVTEPIVTAPAPEFTVIPLVPSVSARLVPPPNKACVNEEVKRSPPTERSALRFTVCAVASEVALKTATSPVPGSAAGVAPPPTTVDQFATDPQSLAVPPELSQNRSAADAIGVQAKQIVEARKRRLGFMNSKGRGLRFKQMGLCYRKGKAASDRLPIDIRFRELQPKDG
jgi:hypothetical protein